MALKKKKKENGPNDVIHKYICKVNKVKLYIYTCILSGVTRILSGLKCFFN